MFEVKFLGPYTVLKQIGDLHYLLQAANGTRLVAHYNRLEHMRLRNSDGFDDPPHPIVTYPEDPWHSVAHDNGYYIQRVSAFKRRISARRKGETADLLRSKETPSEQQNDTTVIMAIVAAAESEPAQTTYAASSYTTCSQHRN